MYNTLYADKKKEREGRGGLDMYMYSKKRDVGEGEVGEGEQG